MSVCVCGHDEREHLAGDVCVAMVATEPGDFEVDPLFEDFGICPCVRFRASVAGGGPGQSGVPLSDDRVSARARALLAPVGVLLGVGRALLEAFGGSRGSGAGGASARECQQDGGQASENAPVGR